VLNVRNTAQTTRILRYNLESGMFDAEYAYRFDDPSTFPLDSNLDLPGRARDLKLSALVALDDDTLLALERTDFLAKVYLVETSGATNILGTWDCAGAAKSFLGGVSVPVCAGATGASSLEQLSAAGLASNLIAVIAKTRLVTAIDARAGLPEKIEGLAVLNEDQIAVANDNDFNVLAGGSGVAFDAGSGNMILRSPGAANHVIRIKLPEPLPLGG
jgi:hypothetical protein